MNKRQLLFVLLILIFFQDQALCQARNFPAEILLLKKTILQHHIKPRKIDNKFSQWVYEYMLQELDPDRLYFNEHEIKTLSEFKFSLDDEINGAPFVFLPVITKNYKKALERAQRNAEGLFQSRFSFADNEIFSPDTVWARDDNQLLERWRLLCKYETLKRLLEMRLPDPDADEKKFLDANEPVARERARAGLTQSIKRILNHASGFENYMGTLYLQAIAFSFDPHSAYLSPTAMENFMASLSSKGYYFGLMLDENEKGEIVIDQLTPGGSAWKSGALNSGDVIRKVKWDGKEPIDLYGVSLDQINDLLLESNHSSLEITVTKAGGIPETIILRKEMIEAEENVVKSFVLQGEKKIGYISLPDFYTNWGEAEGAKCANDVAKEIIKLSREKIEGLILDLRFNGGGSMHEAVAMAGIFIDAGPIGIVKNKNGEGFTLKDSNRGTVYEGPLLVMVNGMSASASEFLTAALQDYNRAIVVGSRTYGKATAQTLFPVDIRNPAAGASADLKPGIPYASVTIEKIYRITGTTVQLQGVTPDIIFPDIYDSLEFREDVFELALPSDSIDKKTYYQPLPELPLEQLLHNHKSRLQRHEGFGMIKQASWLLSEEQHQPITSLEWTTYKTHADNKLEAFSKIESEGKTSNVYTVTHHSFEKQRMQLDEYIDAFNKQWIKKLEQDISLEEAFHIICDYIDLTTKK